MNTMPTFKIDNETILRILNYEDDEIQERRKYRKNKPLCLICELNLGTSGRGLCKKCWEEHRDKMPMIKANTAHRGYGLDNPSLPPVSREPTRFLPGTEGKIRIMKERASKGESLWHPQDAKLE